MAKHPSFINVVSSNVHSIGHHEDEGRLHVKFKSGAHYVYEGVPRSVYVEALASGSVGKFIANRIKGQFKHEKL